MTKHMDQKGLIEVHTSLLAVGWDIHVEMTGRTKRDEVIQYSLSHPRVSNKDLLVTLKYPIKSETGKYDLEIINASKMISRSSYVSEAEAQYSLRDLCESLISQNKSNVT